MPWSYLLVPAIAPTAAAALFLAIYFATKRTIFRKLASVLMLIGTVMWIAPVLIAFGVLPMPMMQRR